MHNSLVFISHSARDSQIAAMICSTLENRGVRCWIAPRDITPGKDWGEAIIDGISGCRIMVLIYSGSSNQSVQVRREVERAVGKGLVIVPFRIEDVPMSKSLEYFLSSPHWLDALTRPLDPYVRKLVTTVQALLGDDVQSDVRVNTPPNSPMAHPNETKPLTLLWASIGLGIVLSFAMVALWFLWRPGEILQGDGVSASPKDARGGAAENETDATDAMVQNRKIENSSPPPSIGSIELVPQLSNAGVPSQDLSLLPNDGNPWTDLLEGASLDSGIVDGGWEMRNGNIGIDQRPGGAFSLSSTRVTADSYELEIVFIRERGEKAVGAIFPVGSRHCAFEIGEGPLSWFALIDGMAEGNSTVKPNRIVPGTRHTARLRVSTDGSEATIALTLDGSEYLTWKGALAGLSLANGRTAATGEIQLLSFGSQNTSWFHSVRMRNLD